MTLRWNRDWPWAELGRFRFWNPWEEIRRLQRQVNRLFEDMGVGMPIRTYRANPPINILETNDSVIITAEVPGVKPEDLSLTVTGNCLTLKGCRKPSADESKVTYERRERTLDEFARTIQLPDTVQSDRATAEFSQGILTVRIPKSPEAIPRQIPVQTT